MRNQRRRFWNSVCDIETTYQYYRNRLINLAISRFEWQALPPSCDPIFLEKTLCLDGHAVFFEQNGIFAALTANLTGRPDVYNNMKKRDVYAVTGLHLQKSYKNSVIIYNNMLKTGDGLVIDYFAKKLAEIENTIMVNVSAQKTPLLLTASDSQRLSVENAYKNYQGGVPALFLKKTFDMDSIKVLNTDAPYTADRLYELKSRYWNEALTFLGIANVGYQKQAHLIKDEVQREMGGVLASRQSAERARKLAAEQINEMFGLNVFVEFKEPGAADSVPEPESEVGEE